MFSAVNFSLGVFIENPSMVFCGHSEEAFEDDEGCLQTEQMYFENHSRKFVQRLTTSMNSDFNSPRKPKKPEFFDADDFEETLKKELSTKELENLVEKPAAPGTDLPEVMRCRTNTLVHLKEECRNNIEKNTDHIKKIYNEFLNDDDDPLQLENFKRLFNFLYKENTRIKKRIRIYDGLHREDEELNDKSPKKEDLMEEGLKQVGGGKGMPSLGLSIEMKSSPSLDSNILSSQKKTKSRLEHPTKKLSDINFGGIPCNEGDYDEGDYDDSPVHGALHAPTGLYEFAKPDKNKDVAIKELLGKFSGLQHLGYDGTDDPLHHVMLNFIDCRGRVRQNKSFIDRVKKLLKKDPTETLKDLRSLYETTYLFFLHLGDKSDKSFEDFILYEAGVRGVVNSRFRVDAIKNLMNGELSLEEKTKALPEEVKLMLVGLARACDALLKLEREFLENKKKELLKLQQQTSSQDFVEKPTKQRKGPAETTKMADVVKSNDWRKFLDDLIKELDKEQKVLIKNEERALEILESLHETGNHMEKCVGNAKEKVEDLNRNIWKNQEILKNIEKRNSGPLKLRMLTEEHPDLDLEKKEPSDFKPQRFTNNDGRELNDAMMKFCNDFFLHCNNETLRNGCAKGPQVSKFEFFIDDSHEHDIKQRGIFHIVDMFMGCSGMVVVSQESKFKDDEKDEAGDGNFMEQLNSGKEFEATRCKSIGIADGGVVRRLDVVVLIKNEDKENDNLSVNKNELGKSMEMVVISQDQKMEPTTPKKTPKKLTITFKCELSPIQKDDLDFVEDDLFVKAKKEYDELIKEKKIIHEELQELQELHYLHSNFDLINYDSVEKNKFSAPVAKKTEVEGGDSGATDIDFRQFVIKNKQGVNTLYEYVVTEVSCGKEVKCTSGIDRVFIALRQQIQGGIQNGISKCDKLVPYEINSCTVFRDGFVPLFESTVDSKTVVHGAFVTYSNVFSSNTDFNCVPVTLKVRKKMRWRGRHSGNVFPTLEYSEKSSIYVPEIADLKTQDRVRLEYFIKPIIQKDSENNTEIATQNVVKIPVKHIGIEEHEARLLKKILNKYKKHNEDAEDFESRISKYIQKLINGNMCLKLGDDDVYANIIWQHRKKENVDGLQGVDICMLGGHLIINGECYGEVRLFYVNVEDAKIILEIKLPEQTIIHRCSITTELKTFFDQQEYESVEDDDVKTKHERAMKQSYIDGLCNEFSTQMLKFVPELEQTTKEALKNAKKVSPLEFLTPMEIYEVCLPLFENAKRLSLKNENPIKFGKANEKEIIEDIKTKKGMFAELDKQIEEKRQEQLKELWDKFCDTSVKDIHSHLMNPGFHMSRIPLFKHKGPGKNMAFNLIINDELKLDFVCINGLNGAKLWKREITYAPDETFGQLRDRLMKDYELEQNEGLVNMKKRYEAGLSPGFYHLFELIGGCRLTKTQYNQRIICIVATMMLIIFAVQLVSRGVVSRLFSKILSIAVGICGLAAVVIVALLFLRDNTIMYQIKICTFVEIFILFVIAITLAVAVAASYRIVNNKLNLAQKILPRKRKSRLTA